MQIFYVICLDCAVSIHLFDHNTITSVFKQMWLFKIEWIKNNL